MELFESIFWNLTEILRIVNLQGTQIVIFINNLFFLVQEHSNEESVDVESLSFSKKGHRNPNKHKILYAENPPSRNAKGYYDSKRSNDYGVGVLHCLDGYSHGYSAVPNSGASSFSSSCRSMISTQVCIPRYA
jgi:hypothetical protein